jgi:hypothetical protein
MTAQAARMSPLAHHSNPTGCLCPPFVIIVVNLKLNARSVNVIENKGSLRKVWGAYLVCG